MNEKDQYKNRIELLQGTLDMLILQRRRCVSEQSGMVEFRDIDKEIPVTHLMTPREAPPPRLPFHFKFAAFIHHDQPVGGPQAGEDFFARKFIDVFP